MKQSFAQAMLFTAAVTGALWLFLHALWSPEAWPAPEMRPLQGEAVDKARLSSGVVTHSAAALRRVVREPQNAWSNLAYVLAGALIGAHFRGRLLRGVALAMIGVGIGSFLYHASASGTLRAVDVGAMYWLFGHLALLALASLRPRFAAWCERWAVSLTCGLLVASMAVTPRRGVSVWGIKPFDISLVTGTAALVLAAALLARAVHARRWSAWAWPAGSAILFAFAAALQIGDRAGGWCWNPHAVLQGHALWHLLSATASGLAVWGLARPTGQ
jgi:hypothetical protein